MALTSPIIIFAACLSPAQALVDGFSTNAICTQNNCVNPIFPGLQDLQGMSNSSWTCPQEDVRQHLQFCAGAVSYSVAVRASQDTNASVRELVVKQEQMASESYFYHLAGMNLEGWDYKNPSEHDECIQSIWRMVCNTYLPKAPKYCKPGQAVKYQLPCQSVCTRYTRACSVECCDESPKCVLDNGKSFEAPYDDFRGYYKADAPSAECTGSGARRAAGFSGPAFLMLGLLGLLPSSSAQGLTEHLRPSSRTCLGAVLALAAMSLQGCDIGSTLGAWELKPSFLLKFSYTVPLPSEDGAASLSPKKVSVLNSCAVPGLPDSMKCSGNGICKNWTAGSDAISFCECGRDWMDPECRTRRKSQLTAFSLSILLGFVGADRFYLGELPTATLKMATLGGGGIWWAWDVVRIGAAPIYTKSQGRLAADLPHFLFVIIAVIWAMAMAYFVFGVLGFYLHENRVLEKALLQAERWHFDMAKQKSPHAKRGHGNPEDALGMPTLSSYRWMAPPPGPESYYGTMAAAAPEVKLAAYKNPLSSFFSYAKASEDPILTASGAFDRPTATPPPYPDDADGSNSF